MKGRPLSAAYSSAAELAGEVARLTTEMVRLRRHLHMHPELAFREIETASLIAQRCRELGLSVRTGVGGTGVLADLDGGRPGPTVLVRADMDALPIEEGVDGRPYRSTVPGVMHACGHDGHVAVALAVAEILAGMGDRLPGRVRMCFQPAEETDAGARQMIEAGAMESVDRAIGMHLQAGLDTGTVAIGAGVQWASSEEIHIHVRGAGGHAGEPVATVDPVAAAAELVLELEQLTRSGADVARIAQVEAGTAPNITPEAVTLAGTLRAVHDRHALRERVERILGRLADERDVGVDLTIGADCPAVVCDPDATIAVRTAIEGARSVDRVTHGMATTASDDMGRFLEAVPGCYFRVGASAPDGAQAHPHHHPLFDLDERALPIAAEALTRGALALLEQES